MSPMSKADGLPGIAVGYGKSQERGNGYEIRQYMDKMNKALKSVK